MRILIGLFVAAALSAQTPQPHSVTLSWTDTANPAGTAYNVYRASGLCTGTPTFNKIASAVAVKTYEDAAVQPGNYCYQVTATANSVESGPSNTALAAVASYPPTLLMVVVR